MPARLLIVGGIGSGKSTVASWFETHGVVVLSADDAARRVLDPGTPETQAVLERWPGVERDGAIDRGALGRIVFADLEALEALEAIVHPATRRRLLGEISDHSTDHLAVEMPIVRDWFGHEWVTIVVDAPDDLRVARVMARGAMTEGEVRSVIARQPTREEWLLAADFVIDNRGPLDALEDQCTEIWERLPAS